MEGDDQPSLDSGSLDLAFWIRGLNKLYGD